MTNTSSRRHRYLNPTFQTRPRRAGVDRDTGLTIAELTGHQRALREQMYARLAQPAAQPRTKGTR